MHARGQVGFRPGAKKGHLRALLFLASTLTVPAAEAAIPPILYADLPHRDLSYPVWVGVEAALTPSGELDEDLFTPPSLRSLRRLLHSAPDTRRGCIEDAEHYESIVDAPDRTSLAKVLSTSAAVFDGLVTDQNYGFARGVPGQLLELSVENAVKGTRVGDRRYVFFPVVRFYIGERPLCKTDSRYPDVPEVGDHVLVLAPDGFYAPAEEYVELVWATSIVTFPERGAASFPWELHAGPELQGKSREVVLEAVSRLLRRLGEGQDPR